jgi:hypothetical protein
MQDKETEKHKAKLLELLQKKEKQERKDYKNKG